MGRIQTTFDALKAQGRKALIPYVTAGDPFADASVDVMRAMARSGADVIELGVPFSDPMADGPVIQKAAERALAKGIGMRQVLDIVRGFRTHDAAAAGVDGVLIVDYPPEECDAFAALLRRRALDPIFLLAPTSTEQRMKDVGRIATGYVYYVSLKGVTGAGHLDTGAVAAMVPRIKQFVKLPVGVGFGIRDAKTAQAVAAVSDAVVIGTALVQLLETCTRDNVAAKAGAFIAEIRKALDS